MKKTKSKLFLAILLITFLGSCTAPAPEPISQPLDEQYLVRGRELVMGLASCGYCHGKTNKPEAPLSGGRMQQDISGSILAPNLTPAKTGLKGWTSDSILSALRASSLDDVSLFSPEVHKGYEWMSDQDALSVVAYIKLLDPVENRVERRDESLSDRGNLDFWSENPVKIGYVPEINKKFSVAYGRYLVDHVARCQSCHNSPGDFLTDEGYLQGGKTVVSDKGETTAPALGGSYTNGLGAWSELEIVNYLKTGITAQRKRVDYNYCPTNFYANGSEEDLVSIARYLKSLAAK